MASILITGGSGFIGNAVAAALLAAGHDVTAFDRAPPPDAVGAHLTSLRGRFAFVPGDVLARDSLSDALARERPAAILHAAVITASVERERRDAATIASVNLVGAINLLDAGRARDVPRIVYLSSASVYGESAFGRAELDEERTTPVPDTLYAITKYAAERYALRVAHREGADVRVVRLGTAFGPFERETGLRDTMSPPFQLMRLAWRGEPAVLERDARRDWIYSRDLGAALTMLLTEARATPPILNLGLGAEYTLLQFAERLGTRFPGFTARLAEPGEAANVAVFGAMDRAPLATRRLIDEVGFRPQFGRLAAADDYAAWTTNQPELTRACLA